MNRIAEARNDLYEALAPVLPGRVAASPPTPQRAYVAPYIWVEQPDLSTTIVGTATELTLATFPIWIAYDGSVAAQIAGLDDLVARVWDAVLRVARARPTSATASTLDVNGATVRGVVVSVDVTLGALTLCLPTLAPAPAPIPPEPVPA